MLGTLHHFRPGEEVARDAMPELERYMLHQLAEQSEIVRKAYAEFDYKTVVATLSAFMNTELSAFYFDIRKDTLYCDPPSSLARKAALTTIDILCDAILKWLAPVLSFTCDEAWPMYRPGESPSVHLLTFPENLAGFRDDALAAKWETVRNVRRVVTGALEVERAAKRIGSSLEASPIVYVSDKKILATLFDVDLAEVCITSSYEVREGEASADAFRLNDVPDVAVVVEKAVGTKCARSWKILPTVGDDPEYPDVSPRDAQALREWKALNGQPTVPTAPGPVPELKVVAVVAEPIEKQPIRQESPLEEVSEKASSKKVTAGKTDRKASAEKVKAKKPVEAKKTAGAKKAAEAKRAAEAKKAAEAKTAAAAEKAAEAKKVAKSKKASLATKGAKKKTANHAKKKKKKAAKKSGKKSKPVTRVKKKKKAR
jgi:isoleucyl-tRNA synthetase